MTSGELAPPTISSDPVTEMDRTPFSFITYDGQYNDDVDEYIHDVKAFGFSYNVASILGCQSSGKSTLLNEIFGTDFEVMDATYGRGQTTKGLWISQDFKKEATERPLLIVDVEGTDSKERGEDRASFEHRASLFSLAMSDLVIMNMWYTDIGRYTASNYGLLRTVLQVNLELFGQDSLRKQTKTHLVFVIRDYSPLLTSLDRLEESLLKDVHTLWSEIDKPPGLEDSKATDFFILACVGLPSRVMMPDDFKVKAQEFRNTIRTAWLPQEYSKKIPYDGFQSYTASVWSAIMNSSDLDIPSQKKMLATFRCEELQNQALTLVEQTLKSERLDVENLLMTPPFDEINKRFSKLAEEAISLYDGHGFRYDTEIFEKIRASTIRQFSLELQSFVSHRVAHFVKEQQEKHISKLWGMTKEMITEGKDGLPDASELVHIAKVLDEWQREGIQTLTESYGSIRCSFPPIATSLGDRKDRELQRHANWGEPSEWRFDLTDISKAVSEKMEDKCFQCFREIRDAFFSGMSETFKRIVWPSSGLTETMLNTNLSGPEFWKTVNSLLDATFNKMHGSYGPVFDALSSGIYEESVTAGSPGECTTFRAFLVCSLRNHLVDLATTEERLIRIVTDRFDGLFYDDEDNVPRNWVQMSHEDIGKCYKTSRDGGYVILDDLASDSRINVEASDQPIVEAQLQKSGVHSISSPIVDSHVKCRITDRAARHMKRAVTDAQAINASGGIVGLPPWPYWVAVAILGYNEFIAILSSPIILFSVVCLLTLVATLYVSGNMAYLRTIIASMTAFVASVLLPFIRTLATQELRGDARTVD